MGVGILKPAKTTPLGNCMFSMEDEAGTRRPVTLVSGPEHAVSSLSDTQLEFLLGLGAMQRDAVYDGIGAML